MVHPLEGVSGFYRGLIQALADVFWWKLLRGFRWEVFFVDAGYYYVVGVDHFGQVEAAYFGEEFVGVQFGEGVVAVDPVDQFGDGDADGVVDGAVDSGGHEFVIVFETGPAGGLALDEFEAEFGFHGDFDGAAGDFTIAHGGVAIAEVEERAFYIHR